MSKHWKTGLVVLFVLSAGLLLRHAWREGVPHPEVAAPFATPPSSELKWETPQGWKEVPASGMRKASFLVEAGGLQGDASIIILGGGSGSLAANVNRWRGQIGLSSLPADQIEKEAKSENGKSGPFQWFHLEGEKSILAAIFKKAETTLFIKLMGPGSLVEKNVDKFLDLCRSVEW